MNQPSAFQTQYSLSKTRKLILIGSVAIIILVFVFIYSNKTIEKITTGYVGCSTSPEGLPWIAKILGKEVFASPPTLEPSLVTKSRLCFTDNPNLNKPVELVFEFKRGNEKNPTGEPISVTTNIQIPEGFVIVSGSPTWSGMLAEGKTEKVSLMVKATKPGYYRFKSSIIMGTFTGSASTLWVEISSQDSKVGREPKDMWNKNGAVRESSNPFQDSKDDNIFGFQPGNFGKGHDPQITSSLVLSNPLEFGKESLLTYSVTPKIYLPDNTKIFLQFPENAFDIISTGGSSSERIDQNNSGFIVWNGSIKKGQQVQVSIRLKVKNYGWGNISAVTQLMKEYDPNRPPQESSTLVNDETVLNLYLDKYGKSVSVLGDDLKSFNLSELHY